MFTSSGKSAAVRRRMTVLPARKLASSLGEASGRHAGCARSPLTQLVPGETHAPSQRKMSRIDVQHEFVIGLAPSGQ